MQWLYQHLQLEGKVVVMKMDIEGSEYGVFRNMLTHGLLCSDKLLFATVELHCRTKDKRHCFSLQELSAAVHVQWPQCERPSLIVIKDDESYLHDGMPLPCKQ